MKMTGTICAPIAGGKFQRCKGNTYAAFGTTRALTDTSLADYAEVVVYRSEIDRLG